MTDEPTIRECCTDEGNRSEPEDRGNGLTVSRCGVCGASHYLLNIDPADLRSLVAEV